MLRGEVFRRKRRRTVLRVEFIARLLRSSPASPRPTSLNGKQASCTSTVPRLPLAPVKDSGMRRWSVLTECVADTMRTSANGKGRSEWLQGRARAGPVEIHSHSLQAFRRIGCRSLPWRDSRSDDGRLQSHLRNLMHGSTTRMDVSVFSPERRFAVNSTVAPSPMPESKDRSLTRKACVEKGIL